MTPRPFLALISLVLIAGAALLIFLTLLGGAVDTNPTNQYYFLEADTSGIAGAPPLTRWTFWNACGVQNGRNTCPKIRAAYPLDPPRNFDGPEDEIPVQFLQNQSRYYYLTRCMFAFVLMGLFFAICSLFLGALALCSRIGSFLSSTLCFVAFFFQSLSAALMTAAYVLGRRNFRSVGRAANLGKYNFGFMWAAMFCLLLATILLCVGGIASGRNKHNGPPSNTVHNPARIKFFQRKKNVQNRRSYIDSESKRQVAEEYP